MIKWKIFWGDFGGFSHYFWWGKLAMTWEPCYEGVAGCRSRYCKQHIAVTFGFIKGYVCISNIMVLQENYSSEATLAPQRTWCWSNIKYQANLGSMELMLHQHWGNKFDHSIFASEKPVLVDFICFQFNLCLLYHQNFPSHSHQHPPICITQPFALVSYTSASS